MESSLKKTLFAAALVALSCGKTQEPPPTGDTIQTDGPTTFLNGLAGPVSVDTDNYGIPHILCTTDVDCVRVYGWIQARDRLFEMDLVRHLAQGRLSEMLGDLGLSADRYYRTAFMSPRGKLVHEEILATLAPGDRAVLDAYAEGVNAYLNQLRTKPKDFPLPAEYGRLPFARTAADVEDWQPIDSIAIGRYQTWDLSNSLSSELSWGKLYAKLTPDQLVEIIRFKAPEQSYTLPGFDGYNSPPMARPLVPAGTIAAAKRLATQGELLTRYDALANIDQLLAGGEAKGSNNWVVGPAKSASGAAMLANDPHLALRSPATFHLVHMARAATSAPNDSFEVIGAAFPGVPVVAIGRTPHLAWGVTVAYYDVTDVYTETLSNGGDAVKFKGADVAVVKSIQNIKVRTGDGPTAFREEPLTVKVVPHHGPILYGTDDGKTAMSMKWAGQEPSYEPSAFWKFAHSISVEQAKIAVLDFKVGAQNFVFADDSGHIAYYPHANVPKRTGDLKKNPPWAPLPGDGTVEWDGFIPDAELPQVTDPMKGFIATANADMVGTTDDNDPLNDKHYLAGPHFDVGFRHKRIVERLTAKEKLSLEDLQSIQADVKSTVGARYTAQILAAAAKRPDLVTSLKLDDAVNRLKAWSFECPTGLTGTTADSAFVPAGSGQANDSIACAIFHSFLSKFTRDALGDEYKAAGIDPNLSWMTRSTLHLLEDPLSTAGAAVLDDPATMAVETKEEAVLNSLKRGVDALATAWTADPEKWRWGRMHTTTFLGFLSDITHEFDMGPFANDGGQFTVDVADMPANGSDFMQRNGPNIRIVSELGPTPRVRVSFPGGQVDQQKSAHSSDLAEGWVTNTSFDVPFAAADIKAQRESGENFRPPFGTTTK